MPIDLVKQGMISGSSTTQGPLDLIGEGMLDKQVSPDIEYPEQVKPTDPLKKAWEVAKYPVAVGEAAVGLGAGMLAYPFSAAAGVGTLALGGSAEEAKQRAEAVAGAAIPYQPRTELGKRTMEFIGKGFETALIPTTMATQELEKTHPKMAYLLGLTGELVTLAGLHSGTVKLAKSGILTRRAKRKLKGEITKAEDLTTPEKDLIMEAVKEAEVEMNAKAKLTDPINVEAGKRVGEQVESSLLETLNKIKEEKVKAEAKPVIEEPILKAEPDMLPSKIDDSKPVDLVGKDIIKPKVTPELEPEIKSVEPEMLPSKIERSVDTAADNILALLKDEAPVEGKSPVNMDALRQQEAALLKEYQAAKPENFRDQFEYEDFINKKEFELGEIRKELRKEDAKSVDESSIKDYYDDEFETPSGEDIYDAFEPTELTPEMDFRDPGLVEDLFSVLKEERGSFSREVLGPEKFAAVERVQAKLKQGGRKVFDTMVEMGIDPRVAAEAAKKFGESPDEIKNNPKQLLFAEGSEIIKQRKIIVNGKKYYKPPITKKILRGLKDIYEIPDGIFKGSYTGTIYQVERMGGLAKEIYYKAREANHSYVKELKAEQTFIRELKKDLSRKEWEEVGIEWINTEKHGPEILKGGGITKIPTLNKKQLRAKARLEEKFANHYNRGNHTRLSIGQRPYTKTKNYLTFFRQNGILEELGLQPNIINDKAFIINEKHKPQASMTGFRFGKRRTGYKGFVELNPVDIYSHYINSSLRHIHMSPVIATIAEFLRPIKDPKTGKFGSLKDYKPNAAEFFRKWSNRLAGLEEHPQPALIKKIVKKVNSNLALSILAGNIRTGIVQLAVARNLPIYVPLKSAGIGIKKVLFGKSNARKLSHVIESNSMEVAISDIYDSLALGSYGGHGKLTKLGKVGKALGSLEKVKTDIGKKVLETTVFLDPIARQITWEAAHHHGKTKLKLSGEKLRQYADDITVKVNASSSVVDIAPIQGSLLGKALTLFQTFVINDWNLFTKDVLGIRNRNLTNKEAFTRTFKYILATSLITSIFEDGLGTTSPFPTPARALYKGIKEDKDPFRIGLDVTKELLEPIPVIGGMRYGSTMLGPTAEVVNEISKQLTDDPFKKNILELVVMVGGVPMANQVYKMIKAGKRGEDIYGMLIGRYRPEEKRSRRKRRPSRPSR